MLWPSFHFHSVLLIFVTLWSISTLCEADMVHAVADMVWPIRLWPIWFVADIVVSHHQQSRSRFHMFKAVRIKTVFVGSACRPYENNRRLLNAVNIC